MDIIVSKSSLKQEPESTASSKDNNIRKTETKRVRVQLLRLRWCQQKSVDDRMPTPRSYRQVRVTGASCDLNGPLPDTDSPPQRSCLCCKLSNDRDVALIISVAAMIFLSMALTAFPLILLVNKRIAGSAQNPNSASVFVYTTIRFLHNFTSFMFGRYTGGLGDYTGRKPVLVMSILNFVLSRVIYLGAYTPGAFYVAAIISGSYDCFYFTVLAWICDLFPEANGRSKRVGVFVGVGGGVAFVIGAPLGVVLAVQTSIETPIIISIIINLVCAILIIMMPVNDTLGVRVDNAFSIPGCSKRKLPPNIKTYFYDHFPLGPGTWDLIKSADYPLDWLGNFMMHSTAGLANLILLQFCLAIFNWTAIYASIAVLSIGVGLAIFSPILLYRYSPIPVVLYTIMGFFTGLVLLAVSGAGLKDSQIIGSAGIFMFAACATWVPAMQTMLTSQYPKEMQGAITGLLSQSNDLSFVLSYVLSLGFTYSIRRNSAVYWPGSSWAAAAVVAAASGALHYHVHGPAASLLTRQTVLNQLQVIDDSPELTKIEPCSQTSRVIELGALSTWNASVKIV